MKTPEVSTKAVARDPEWSQQLRARFLGIGMLAVAIACLVFTVSRGWMQWRSGLLTPWLYNLGGLIAIGALYLWYRRAPAQRSEIAVNGTAAVATVLLVVPLAYAMPSSMWWLSLVGFAMTLMSRRREAALWATLTVALIAAAPLLEPLMHVPGSAGEPALEANLARTIFAVLLFGIAYAFRREIEQRTADLSALTANLQAANAARDRFLAHMSHELRTPLHGMLGMSEHALAAAHDATQRRQLEAIRDSGTALLRLLNDVLDAGRANADTLELDARPFALHTAIAEVLPPFFAQARELGLECRAQAHPGLRLWRNGDAARLRQIVLTLMSNAFKFTVKGRVALQLDPWADHDDGVVLRVSDSGIGVPQSLIDQLGQPFVRLDEGPARAHGGAGLGLAILSQLAERMQGRMRIESTTEGGTVATVWLRLSLTEDAAIGPADLASTRPSAEAPGLLPAHPHRPLHVLVCEDDTLAQEFVAATLTLLGHNYALADDGAQGMTLAEAHSFDLVLTDIEMPNLDGYAFLERFRRQALERGHMHVPVIAVTAHAEPKDRERFLAMGFDDYVAKPFAIADLRRTLALLQEQTAAASADAASTP